MDSTTSLLDRIQSLPQELYDIIYELTFKLQSGAVDIDRHYKLPFQLHINREMRENCAQQYFSNQFNFQFRDAHSHDLAVKFLTAISKAHVQLITELRLLGTLEMSAEATLARRAVLCHLFGNYHEKSPMRIIICPSRPLGDRPYIIRLKFERPLNGFDGIEWAS